MLRHAETAKSGQSKNMANERKWHELLTSGLSSTEHRFKEGPWQEQQIPRGLEHMSMKEFFCPRPRSAPAWLREIMGKNRSPTYWSPKPTNEIQQYIDNVLARHCLERDDWHACDTAWLCMLAQSSSLMLTHEAFKGQCYFSLGEFSSSTVAGWPARKHNIKGVTYYSPQLNVSFEDVRIMVVNELDGWSSWSFEWLSPAHLKLRAGVVGEKLGLAACQLKEPAPLLETAARACFWKLSKTVVGQIAKHLGLAVGIALTGGRGMNSSTHNATFKSTV